VRRGQDTWRRIVEREGRERETGRERRQRGVIERDRKTETEGNRDRERERDTGKQRQKVLRQQTCSHFKTELARASFTLYPVFAEVSKKAQQPTSLAVTKPSSREICTISGRLQERKETLNLTELISDVCFVANQDDSCPRLNPYR
jgi:hypothetical protein